MSMTDTVEINSASLQGIDPSKPLEVIYPPVVTDTMLNNASKAIDLFKEKLPNCNIGLNLHAGEVIDLERVEQSGLNITSIDTPDIGYPKEFLEKLKQRPDQAIAHIAWRLNSILGLTEEHAKKRRLEQLKGMTDLEPFFSNPFVRVSAERDPKTGKPDTSLIQDILRTYPAGCIAVEYNAENLTIDEYITFIKQLRTTHSNIGFSMDLAHIFEYFKITEGRESESAKEATLNVWKDILKERSNSVFSVDINNVDPNVKKYGDTHSNVLTPGGVIPTQDIISEYRKYLNQSSYLQGRLAIESFPQQSKMLIDREGSAYLLSQIKPFSI